MSTFRLPDLGEGLAEAEIIEWHVSVGDHVRVDQPMVSVETAKAVVEVPAPFSGIVTALQNHTFFAAFDLVAKTRDEVVTMLKAWTDAAARMTDTGVRSSCETPAANSICSFPSVCARWLEITTAMRLAPSTSSIPKLIARSRCRTP